MNWAYGITTVPQRHNNEFTRTLQSLKNAGFDSPRLFIDGAKDDIDYQYLQLETTTHYPAVKSFGNWILALWELYIRSPTTVRFAIFQDDLVACKNLRLYLESVPYPDKGYLNLYTCPSNESIIKDRQGWIPSNQRGLGALGLVFDLTAVTSILRSYAHIVERPQHSKKGTNGIDGAVVSALKKQQYIEYVHSPSLIQHIGTASSMEHGAFISSRSFPGEAVDALTFSGNFELGRTLIDENGNPPSC